MRIKYLHAKESRWSKLNEIYLKNKLRAIVIKKCESNCFCLHEGCIQKTYGKIIFITKYSNFIHTIWKWSNNGLETCKVVRVSIVEILLKDIYI